VRTNYRGGRTSVSHLRNARTLRRTSTDAERALWRLLRDRQLPGAKFRRQHQIGPFVVDFFCAEHRLVVEADGGQHLTAAGRARDAERAAFLQRRGVRTLRFSDRDVLLEAEGVLQAILSAIERPSP
jgi:very-short-patch-repair endonuclease